MAMNSDSDNRSYRPLLDINDRLLENEQAYATRMAPKLPHFPADVLGQWFYDHWMQIGDYSWLDYKALRFKQVHWTTEQVPKDRFGHEELLSSRVQYFRNTTPLPERFSRLLLYMERNGTWPRPIIVLDTQSELPERPAWLARGPYHLLEGHNRVAGLRYLMGRFAIQPSHAVWIASREPAL